MCIILILIHEQCSCLHNTHLLTQCPQNYNPDTSTCNAGPQNTLITETIFLRNRPYCLHHYQQEEAYLINNAYRFHASARQMMMAAEEKKNMVLGTGGEGGEEMLLWEKWNGRLVAFRERFEDGCGFREVLPWEGLEAGERLGGTIDEFRCSL